MSETDDTSAGPASPERGIGKKTARGLKWNLIGNIGANGLRVIVIPILARLLSPIEFGVVAAALTVIAFATFLKDAGVGTAIVQRKDLTQPHIEAAFSFSVLFGIGLSGLLIAIAPFVANFYGTPELTPMVRALALMFAMRGIAVVPQSLARRHMRFRELALIDLGAYFVGSAVTVVMALRGYGAWSLVAGYLCESTLGTIALVALSPVRYAIWPKREPLRDLVNYGAGHTLGELAGYFAYQGDNIVIGYKLDVQQLGFYTRAYDLMRYPSVAFSNIAGAVLFSAFSRIQDDKERLGRAFRRAEFAVSLFLVPISIVIVILAPELVFILLGGKWHDVVLPLQILAISMMPRTTFKIGATIARAAGDVYQVALATVLYGLMVTGGAFYAVQWGILGVAVSTAIAVYINFLLLSHLGIRRTSLGWSGFLASHVEPIITAGVVLACAWPLAHFLRNLAISPWLTVIAVSLAALAAGVVVLAIGVWRRQSDWMWFYGGISSRLRFLPQPL